MTKEMIWLCATVGFTEAVEGPERMDIASEVYCPSCDALLACEIGRSRELCQAHLGWHRKEGR